MSDYSRQSDVSSCSLACTALGSFLIRKDKDNERFAATCQCAGLKILF